MARFEIVVGDSSSYIITFVNTAKGNATALDGTSQSISAPTLIANFVLMSVANLPPWFWAIFSLWSLHKFYSWCDHDYQAFLDLGRGGTPSSLLGWWRIKHLSLFKIPSVLSPPHVPPMLEPYRGLLENIPIRSGARPSVGGVAPQRQTDQKAPRSTFDTLENFLREFTAAHPKELYAQNSFLEKHNVALFATPTPLSNSRVETKTFGYEICHPHRADGSLHMVMHPEDVRTVIEAGWGERHPLARANWWWILYFKLRGELRPPVPETLVFIYAPKDEEELAVVKELLRAAAWWITGVELGENELRKRQKRRRGRSTSS